MIKLQVRDYCHKCPDFEVDCETTIESADCLPEGIEQNSYIRCKHSGRCENIERFIRKSIERSIGVGGERR